MYKLLLASVAAVALSTSAQAELIWNFNSPTGLLGVTQDYSAGPGTPNVTATAFGPGSPHLFGKDDGPDERGLGLSTGATHEIEAGSSVDLNISSLDGNVASLRLSFQAGSTQGDETWLLYGSNTAGVLGTLIASGHNDNRIADLGTDIIGTYSHLDVTAAPGLPGEPAPDVLVQEIDSPTIPEPATIALLGTALLTFGMWIKRRQSS